MNSLKRLIGFLLILIGVVVALHTVIEPVYYTSTEDRPYSPVWDYINPLSAISVIVGLIFGYLRLSRTDEESPLQEFIAANTLFYGFIFAGILFFWNWFAISDFGLDFTPIGMDTRTLVWILFDAILPPLNIAMGAHLLRARGGG